MSHQHGVRQRLHGEFQACSDAGDGFCIASERIPVGLWFSIEYHILANRSVLPAAGQTSRPSSLAASSYGSQWVYNGKNGSVTRPLGVLVSGDAFQQAGSFRSWSKRSVIRMSAITDINR